MAGQTKVNQDGRDHGVQYNPGQIIGIEIDAGASLAAKDGIDGALASIVREFQPLMYKSTSTNGNSSLSAEGRHGINTGFFSFCINNPITFVFKFNTCVGVFCN